MSFSSLGALFFGATKIHCRLLDVWVAEVVGWLECSVVAVEVVCGGDWCLGHPGAVG